MRVIATVLFFGLVFMGLGADLARHGQSKDGEHNFFIALVSVILQLVLLYFMGAFDWIFKVAEV